MPFTLGSPTVCVMAYIKGLHCLRQSINTHDAAGKAHKRVSVSQHTHITPLLPSFLCFLSFCSFLCCCVLFMRKHRGFNLAGRVCDPSLAYRAETTAQQNQSKAANCTLTKALSCCGSQICHRK